MSNLAIEVSGGSLVPPKKSLKSTKGSRFLF